MASFWYYDGVNDILDGTLLLATHDIKIGLSTSVHVPGLDDTFLDDTTSDDFSSGELSNAAQSPVSGYVGEFGGAGRKLLASKTFTKNATDNSSVFDAADPSPWTLGNGGTIEQASIFREITADTSSQMIINLDFTGVTTNTGTFTIQFAAGGIGTADCG